MWELPELGTEPISPTLAGGFFTTEPPLKPCVTFSYSRVTCSLGQGNNSFFWCVGGGKGYKSNRCLLLGDNKEIKYFTNVEYEEVLISSFFLPLYTSRVTSVTPVLSRPFLFTPRYRYIHDFLFLSFFFFLQKWVYTIQRSIIFFLLNNVIDTFCTLYEKEYLPLSKAEIVCHSMCHHFYYFPSSLPIFLLWMILQWTSNICLQCCNEHTFVCSCSLGWVSMDS